MKRLGLIMMLGLGGVLVLSGVQPAHSQEEAFKLVAPPPVVKPPAPELVIPGQPPEITRPREADFRPDNIRVRHDPGFVVPFSKTVRTGPDTAVRFGLSGWTAPPGQGNLLVVREESGALALGFSFVWDVPVEPEKPEGSSAAPR
ncbi:MAG: hypothetical protein ACE5JD_05395 [Candidatus Methylomirabilia bacterium]